MKKKNLVFSIALVSSLASSHAALVSLYTLDDTSSGVAVDSISGNDATWQNGTNTNLANAAGQMGGAADLSDVGGGNNYFQTTLPELIGATGITLSAWINNDGNSGYTGIFMTRNFNGQTNNSWGLAIEPDGGGSWRFDTRVDGPGIDSPAGAAAVNGQWKHVALVWDGSGAGSHVQYVNGVQVSSEVVPGNLLPGSIVGPDSGPWYIGYDDCCGGGRDFDGRIDDVSIWNHALDLSEITAIYQNGLQGISVPEPSTSLFGLLGGLMLLRRRR